MRVYLKIKIKSLAAEATDIHREERKFNIGARGRTRARREQQLRLNDLTDAQRKRIERNLRFPSGKAMEIFTGLRDHRVNVVRPEARATLIAYAFLRGLPYEQVEPSAKTAPNWKRVEELVKKYGEDVLSERMARFTAWSTPEEEEAKAA